MRSKVNKVIQSGNVITMHYITGGVKKFTIHQIPDTNIYVAEKMYYKNVVEAFNSDNDDLKSLATKTAEVYKIPLIDNCEFIKSKKKREPEYDVNISQTWSENITVRASNAQQARLKAWKNWNPKKKNYSITANKK